MSDKDSWKEVFSDGVYKLKMDGSIFFATNFYLQMQQNTPSC